ncbi:hypothetical protein [Planctomycetes bacterium K23_9]|uniref:AAA+ ATPase domain-containing protein n=1 Tax=Stieleria marina TaxID=1930275 RepID=A0A517P1J0_9BACT|nr:hypothetical protein K239x_52400 [Planctomycetes bacterium K23_9]
MSTPKTRPVPQSFAANPFCTRFVRPGAIEYRFDVTRGLDSNDRPLEVLVAAIVRTPYAAIVGPHGTGKSTLLESLRPRLGEAYSHLEFVQLHSPSSSRWQVRRRRHIHNRRVVDDAQQGLASRGSSNESRLLIVDGFEQLSVFARRKILRVAQGTQQALLVTTHAKLRSFETVFRTKIQQRILQQLTDDLLDRASESQRSILKSEIQQRDFSSVQNVREFWFEMYDRAAEVEESLGGDDSHVDAGSQSFD